eukprot:TRINITY_DN67354_c7_g3_i1.p1 TRINITY_DN67354_c7_g3~~TRINITY_DN67354_c7_g3_i1.p1  ORF type:complete len:323 (+),score=38.19 TRINITY_DN67354_c7_g3_i1:34-1002(+)
MPVSPAGVAAMEGVLEKKGGMSKKNYQPRYFKLVMSKLYYYAEKGGKLKGMLDLKHAKVRRHESKPRKFYLSGPEVHKDKNYLLRAASVEECNKWITAIETALKECEKETVEDMLEPLNEELSETTLESLEPATVTTSSSSSSPKPAGRGKRRGQSVLVKDYSDGKWVDQLPPVKPMRPAGPPPAPQVVSVGYDWGKPGGFRHWRCLKLYAKTLSADHDWYNFWFFLKEDEVSEADVDAINGIRAYLACGSLISDDHLVGEIVPALQTTLKGHCFSFMEITVNNGKKNPNPGMFVVLAPKDGEEVARHSFESLTTSGPGKLK